MHIVVLHGYECGGLALSVYIRHFHLQLAVFWTSIDMIVTIPSKRLKNGSIWTREKVSN